MKRPKSAVLTYLNTAVGVSVARHIELLMKETDRGLRTTRKVFGYTAMYGGNPDAVVLLPRHLVEDTDIAAYEASRRGT